ncbi:MAG: 7-cyano-7-deazaguanine synthase QueC [Bdellovibrionaceae bacterium]|nr:7-cyano-7-deazaguanine synthase QueC [Pseudobdellovibrionaceae bacterium]
MYDALILLSGGLDSSVNLYTACAEGKKVLALSFDYGQKAASNELKAAAKLCKLLSCKHKIHKLDFFKSWTKTSLINPKKDIPTNIKLNSKKETKNSAKQVWVPNRNGVFLNIAASFAESLDIPVVYAGFNKEEAETFLDNSKDYVKAVNKALSFSTLNKVKIKSYTQNLNKNQIYKKALNLNIPIAKLWSCYFNGKTPCKECESCQRFFKAHKFNS